MGAWFLSRRDSTIVARHEVPGICLTPALWPEGPAPKGQESLAQGLPWVSGNKRFALKGLARSARDPIKRFGAEPGRTWGPLQG